MLDEGSGCTYETVEWMLLHCMPNYMYAHVCVVTMEPSLSTQAAGERGARRPKEERAESEDRIHYWVPRMRVMFAAEDQTMFAQRVAYAHLAR